MIRLLASLPILLVSFAALAQPYPARPVKMDDALDEPAGPVSPVLPADLDLLPISHASLPPPPAEPNPSL